VVAARPNQSASPGFLWDKLTGVSALLPPSQQPSPSTRDRFLGTWKLVSMQEGPSPDKLQPFPDLGPDARGFLIYTASGYMCAQLMNPERAQWAAAAKPTDAERAAAMRGFASYCGRFEVSEAEQVVIHYPETAWSPNYVGTVQKRPYHFLSDDRLVYAGKNEDGTCWRVEWERLR
jgi:hypothetical protein